MRITPSLRCMAVTPFTAWCPSLWYKLPSRCPYHAAHLRCCALIAEAEGPPPFPSSYAHDAAQLLTQGLQLEGDISHCWPIRGVDAPAGVHDAGGCVWRGEGGHHALRGGYSCRGA